MSATQDLFSMPLFDDLDMPAAAPVPAASPADTLATLRQWSDAGWLRQLDSALAAFMAELDPQAAPAVLVAAALLAHMEGRGHSCLPLAALVQQPAAVLGWPAQTQPALQALWAGLPVALADWRAAMQASSVVYTSGQGEDLGQPLV